MIWIIVGGILLYILGDLIKGAAIEPKPIMWIAIGVWMKRIAVAIFIVLIIISIIGGMKENISVSSTIENAQAFILPAIQTSYLPIRNFNISEPEINARSVLLLDGKTHRVLFAKNPDEKLPIASITKLMTAMVVLDEMNINEVYTVRAEDL